MTNLEILREIGFKCDTYEDELYVHIPIVEDDEIGVDELVFDINDSIKDIIKRILQSVYVSAVFTGQEQIKNKIKDVKINDFKNPFL